MKKLIAIFGSLTLVCSSSTFAVSCSNPQEVVKGGNKHHDKHEKFDLLESEEQMFLGGLTKGIDGSHLSTNNSVSDAFDLIQNDILIECPEAEDIKLVSANKMDDDLKVGKNAIDISYKLKNHRRKVKALVKDVQAVDTGNMIEDHTDAKLKIEQMLKSGLYGSRLYGWNTIFDALNYFKDEAKKINKDANVRFTGEWINKRMGEEIKKLAEEKIEIEGEKKQNLLVQYYKQVLWKAKHLNKKFMTDLCKCLDLILERVLDNL